MWDWMKSEVYKRNVDTLDEFLTRISDAAVSIKRSEDHLRQTTPDIRTRVAKWMERYFGIFKHLL
jgi:hypothetical protein